MLHISHPAQDIWREKLPGRGEDSKVLIKPLDESLLAMAVFDGLGGSGARLLRAAPGVECSAARVAADLARQVTEEVLEQWAATAGEQAMPELACANLQAMLQQRLVQRFTQHAAEVEGEVSPIRGTLRRRLPTTMCLTLAHADKKSDATSVHCLWAGDSRAYLWSGDRGLRQLTRDHTRRAIDAHGALRNDVPMSNFITPDLPFHIESKTCTVEGPCILICATDGCFHYCSSPMHFELMLLRALADIDWSAAARSLEACITEKTQDDISLAIAGLNWGDGLQGRESLRQSALLRFEILRPRCERLHELNTEDDNNLQRTAYLQTWWDEYRHDYESLLSPAGDHS